MLLELPLFVNGTTLVLETSFTGQLSTSFEFFSLTWIIPICGHPSAGKSTLIRLLTPVKARVGKKPGTTRRINAIPMTENLTIKDYPGFGRLAGRSRRKSGKVQQDIVRTLEQEANDILVGIVVTDLSNVKLMAEKLGKKGFVPIDYEMSEFIGEISGKPVIVVGNKIDKLDRGDNPDSYIEYFPQGVQFFPVALKHKKGVEPLLVYLQSVVTDALGEEVEGLFWDNYA